MRTLSLYLLSLVVVVCSATVQPDYESLGCWADKSLKVVGKWHEKGGRRKVDWSTYPDFSAVVNECGKFAKQEGCKMFAIQFWAECYCTKDENADYKAYKTSSKCLGGVGKAGANAVYRVKGCYDEGTFYEAGQKMPSNDVCMDCDCLPSGHKRCLAASCARDTNCPKFTFSANKCCPVCACQDIMGYTYGEGQTWTSRLKDVGCADCLCKGGEAECKPHSCPVLPCTEKVLKPGSCCPECKPKAERITLPPIETLPDFSFPFPFPDKRNEEALVDDMAELVKEKMAASKEE